MENNEFNQSNLDLWTKLFLRVKPIQKVARDMTERVEMILMKELINNKEQLKAYIEYPRKQNTLPLIPPKEQPKLPFDDYGKPKPEKLNEKTPELNKEEKEKQDIAAIHFDKMKSGMAYIEKMMDKIENDNEQIT